MIFDRLLSFVPIGAPISITSAAVGSDVIDLLGQGVGVAPASIFGTPALFGAPDAMGVGGLRPELNITIGTAFAGGTSLNVALQAAADLGTPTYQPDTWKTLAETGLILTAALTASLVIARFPWLPPFPANLRPRYLRVLFTPAGTFTAGTIASALVTTVRDDQFNKYAAKNYAVA
jgi:hypothetical protein